MNKDETNIYASFKKPPYPYWLASTPETDYPILNEDINVDVAIVGGGMTGITSAFLLKKEGLSVAIIEADRILQGTTGHTTAKITSQHTLIYYKIKEKLGEERAHQYAEANESAIKMVEQLVRENNIDCDFKEQSAYVYTHEDNYVQKIADEAEAAAGLGIKATYLDKIPLPFNIKAALRFDNQAQFHPRKYLLALAAKISENGSHIFERTRAIDIVEAGKGYEVITSRGKKVIADRVILASHYPFYDKHGLYFTRLYPYRSYVLGVKIKNRYPDGMYITAEDPGRSFRSQPYDRGELILVSGEHHKTAHGEDTQTHYENLKNLALGTFDVEDIPFRWSTQDYTTTDEVPYIGRLTSTIENIYVATGFRKWGMTSSTVSAMLIKDLITKNGSPWEEVYSPSRFTPSASAKNFIVENADLAKNFIGGKLLPVSADIDIMHGEGKIVEINGEKAGIYRDSNNKLHVVDATCTHMRCELKWNSSEKTWDCPCHGSRFTYEGDIVEGPALQSIKIDIKKEQLKE